MLRNYLKGFTGDKINAILAGAAFNFKIKLREIRLNLFLPFLEGTFGMIIMWLKEVFAEFHLNFKTPKTAF
jgi:hypothetical protein